MTAVSASPRPKAGVGIAGLLLAATVPILIASPIDELVRPLTFVLAFAALASVLGASHWGETVDVSAAFICFMLAVAFLGPVPAFVIAAFAETVAWLVQRYRLVALPVNVAATAVPVLLSALAFEALRGSADEDSVRFILALAAVGVVFLALNWVLLSALAALVDGRSVTRAVRLPRQLVPALALTLALTLAIAGIFAVYGLAAAAFMALSVIAFTYMSRLVIVARERTEQFASLSWGVLSSLLRSLDRRDARTARHSAAVAAFARDIALQCGMSKRDAELAHTAGLLHDIGRFALPDRVMEREGALREEDWEAIQQHPELGSELLKDLGVYGPVAEIVRAHHERLDGRGYPDGLSADEIPEIARVVAVAEVYDTLTAEDTYRARMTSFEALTELRRVAGTQLDGRYVEVLSQLLAGRGLEYRHADRADFDTELGMERRIAESVSPDPASGAGLDTVPEDPAERPAS